jgi:hypothetical protein
MPVKILRVPILLRGGKVHLMQQIEQMFLEQRGMLESETTTTRRTGNESREQFE